MNFSRALGTPRKISLSIAAAVLCAGALLSGCGGSSGGGNTSGNAPASSATVVVKNVSGYGNVLATSSGQTLYLLTADPAGGSKCTGSCAAQWRPLTHPGSPTGGPGVDTSMLSTFKRTDGQQQVLYNKHALYTHTGSGAASGAGIAADGGIWYLVSPSGKPVKSTTSGGY